MMPSIWIRPWVYYTIDLEKCFVYRRVIKVSPSWFLVKFYHSLPWDVIEQISEFQLLDSLRSEKHLAENLTSTELRVLIYNLYKSRISPSSCCVNKLTRERIYCTYSLHYTKHIIYVKKKFILHEALAKKIIFKYLTNSFWTWIYARPKLIVHTHL